MSQFSIGDIVEYDKVWLYFISNMNQNTCTIVQKSGKHHTYSEYLDDDNTAEWDKNHTLYDIPFEDIKLVKNGNDIQ